MKTKDNGEERQRYTQVCLRMPQVTLDALHDHAKDDGRPMSEILRGAIKLYIETSQLPANIRMGYVDISKPTRPKLVSLIEFQR